MFQHYLSRFKELAKFDVFRVYHATGQYTSFKRCINLALSKSRTIPGTILLAQNVHAQYLLNFRVSRYTNDDCLTPIDNYGRLARLCSSTDSMKLSQRCSHARNSSRVFN